MLLLKYVLIGSLIGLIGGESGGRNSNIINKCCHLKKNHGDCGQEIITCKEQGKNRKSFAINTWNTLFKADSFQAGFGCITVKEKT